jgi:hypothetical protein
MSNTIKITNTTIKQEHVHNGRIATIEDDGNAKITIDKLQLQQKHTNGTDAAVISQKPKATAFGKIHDLLTTMTIFHKIISIIFMICLISLVVILSNL